MPSALPAGQPTGASTKPAIDAAASFALECYGTELVLEPAPPGTQGYDDLRRDATEAQLGEDLAVVVASLVDLMRIAEASEDRARVPALRLTLELATARPASRAA